MLHCVIFLRSVWLCCVLLCCVVLRDIHCVCVLFGCVTLHCVCVALVMCCIPLRLRFFWLCCAGGFGYVALNCIANALNCIWLAFGFLCCVWYIAYGGVLLC